MKVAIISDTHSLLRDEVTEKIIDCDIILHGGDIASKETVEAIEKLGRAYFVRGNADKDWAEGIPYEQKMEICGYRFYMVHKKSDIRKDLSGIDFVIYGHSHKYEQKTEDGITYL
ncbi:MAG: metallophosphatase family protein, partial [Lachnospiraceae bacterium]|nr:metallophosphatase family protein [Lachnospiraceae bacterium]